MSKFALVAQAAGLLGQVLKHVSSHTADQELHDEEGMRLDRTLHVHISALSAMNPRYHDPMVICYRYIFTASLQLCNDLTCRSALMALHEPRFSSDRGLLGNSDHCRYARSVTEAVSEMVVTNSPQYLPGLALSRGGFSLWGPRLVYQAGVTYIRLNRKVSTLDSLQALKILQQSLRVVDIRWKAAGIFCSLSF
jgi:hypothetical protein